MPGMSGIEVLRFITKNTPDTQVILLTAHGSLESSIEALRLGALDYLLKPASPETILSSVVKALTKRIEHLQYQELLTKLESSVQTHQGSKEANHALHSQSVECILGSGVKVNFSQRVIWNDQNTISLTPTETRLLKTLSQNPGHVFTPQELVAIAQGYEATTQEAPGILRPLISRLRHKLSVFQDSQNWIVNVRGTGYCFYPGDNLPSL
jgi:two-component system KDP operon response regulator KdpE